MATPKDRRGKHNEYCKAALGDPVLADAVIRPFLEEEVRVQLSKGPPRRLDTSGTGEDLQAGSLDLRFHYRLRRGGLFELVLEHKSWPDQGTPGQLAKYEMLTANEAARADVRLLMVAVLYHGRGRWTVPFAVERSGDGSPAPRPPVGACCYPLWNLMALDLKVLEGAPRAWAAVAAMVGAFREADRGRLLDPLLGALPAEGEFTKQTLEYVCAAWGLDRGELLDRLQSLRGEEGDSMGKNLWDLEDEWFAEGEAKGMAAGEAKGEAKGAAKTLLKLMRVKFKALSADLEARVMAAPPEQVDAWAEAVLTASSLEEALAAVPRR